MEPPRSGREERSDGLAGLDALFGLHGLEVVSSAWAVETMTPDSLEVALRDAADHAPLDTDTFPVTPWCAHLAAATREWMRQQLPPPEGTHEPEYNRALADVAKALGLEP